MWWRRVARETELRGSGGIGAKLGVAGQGTGRRQFACQPGPIAAQVVLADEINRATPKTQSALLEAMQERSVTVSGVTRKLELPFIVLATQNPIEQEGTYRLPEAQLDRFLMYVKVGYPDAATERAILRLTRNDERSIAPPATGLKVTQADVMAMRAACLELHLDEAVEEYIVQLVQATRTPAAYGDDLARWIEFGVSPRGTLGLERCARAHAWLRERDYVSPDDVQAIAADVLRHRVLLSFEAEADGVDSDAVVQHLLERVPVA